MGDDDIRQPKLSREEVEEVHRLMYSATHEPLVRKIFGHVKSGLSGSSLFGIVLDVDDAIWIKHCKLAEDAPIQNFTIGNGVRRLHFGVYDRKHLLHFIHLLPSLADYLSVLPGLGRVHVLILGEGMASPFVMHWSSTCVIDMED